MNAHVLIQRYLNGKSTAEEVEELDALLQTDAVLRAEFRFQAELDAHLCEASRDHESGAEPVPSPARRRLWLPAAAAVFIALAIAVPLFLFSGRSDGTVLTVVGYGGSLTWTGGNETRDNLQLGARLSGGTVESAGPGSWATFRFDDGTTFTVAGNTSLAVTEDGHKELRLKRGSLNVDVTPQPSGRPLAIRTPVAELAVVGTRLDIAVSPARTLLTVREGRVRMTHRTTGESIEVNGAQRGFASLEGAGELRRFPVPAPTFAWTSTLPEGISHGAWLPEFAGEMMGLRAVPRIEYDEAGSAFVVYHAAVSVLGDAPVALARGSRLLIRGKNDSNSSALTVGLTTINPAGGFAGQFTFVCGPDRLTEGGGVFEIEIPIEEFSASRPGSSGPPIDIQLIEWWCATASTDLGVSIFEVRLIPAEGPSPSQSIPPIQ